ncbi:MAG: hypothetical protein D6785_03890 [Planctomycetota bacterium]|nr:MAG: hypothetical protein D6785_03890 [Planctomycetota bacterium]
MNRIPAKIISKRSTQKFKEDSHYCLLKAKVGTRDFQVLVIEEKGASFSIGDKGNLLFREDAAFVTLEPPKGFFTNLQKGRLVGIYEKSFWQNLEIEFEGHSLFFQVLRPDHGLTLQKDAEIYWSVFPHMIIWESLCIT